MSAYQFDERHGTGGGSANQATPFTDVKPGAWYYDAVAACYEQELFFGTAADRFSPDTPMNRAMLVSLLWRADGSVSMGESKEAAAFSDVPQGAWYYDAVCWGKKIGIVRGIDQTHFAPEQAISREQAITIIWRYTKYQMGNLEATNTLSAFQDGKQIGEFAKEAMGWAVADGLMFGVKSDLLCPKQFMTRAQGAMLLQRCLSYWDVVRLTIPLYAVVVTNAQGQTLAYKPDMSYSGTIPVRSSKCFITGDVIHEIEVVIPASASFKFDIGSNAEEQVNCGIQCDETFIQTKTSGCSSVTLTTAGKVTLTGDAITCAVTGTMDMDSVWMTKFSGTCTQTAQFVFNDSSVQLDSDCNQWNVEILPTLVSENWIKTTATVPTPTATVQFLENGSAQTGYFVVK